MRGAPVRPTAEICEATEIKDAGQVSKLMKQLARLGLVENIGAGELTGKAYAWRLTAEGKELLRAAGPAGVRWRRGVQRPRSVRARA